MTSESKHEDNFVKWMGEIPTHWEKKKLKFLVNNKSEKVEKNNKDLAGYIGLENIESWTGKYNINTEIEEIESTSILIKKGNVLFNKLRPYLAKCFISEVDAIGSSELLQLAPKSINNQYLKYIMLSEDFIELVNSSTYGVKMPRASWDFIGNIKIPVPTSSEQQQISKFLDIKTREIDNLIAKKNSLIQSVKKAKQMLITELVTKGLDSNIKFEDSKVKWIGVIPKNWKLKKIKYTTYVKGRIGWQGLRSDEFIEEGPYLVTGTDFDNGKVNWDTCVHITEKRFKEAPAIQLKEDDILITKDGTIGKVAIVKNKPDKASLNSGVFVTRPLYNDYYYKYMYWLLKSDVFKEYVKYNELGSTIKHLYQETFENFVYPSPTIEEQIEISNYLDIKIEEFDELITKVYHQIEVMKKAKHSLITEVVTGKIDVREKIVY